MKQVQPKKRNWVLSGLGWGLCMAIALGVVEPLISGSKMSATTLAIDLVISMGLGLVFGYVLKLYDCEKS